MMSNIGISYYNIMIFYFLECIAIIMKAFNGELFFCAWEKILWGSESFMAKSAAAVFRNLFQFREDRGTSSFSTEKSG